MPNTYSQIYIHVVFAVKHRDGLIHANFIEDLYKYICGIVINKSQKVYAINGMADHIHILLSVKPNCLLSDLVRDIKANSSKWINDNKFIKGKFQWQEGFGAFSHSQHQINTIINYINTQETHHQKKSFKEEYFEILEEFNVDFKEDYLFEWII